MGMMICVLLGYKDLFVELDNGIRLLPSTAVELSSTRLTWLPTLWVKVMTIYTSLGTIFESQKNAPQRSSS